MKLYGDQLAQETALVILPPTATTTTLEAIQAEQRANGVEVSVLADGSSWMYLLASTLTAGTDVHVPDDIEASTAYGNDPTTAPGRWIRKGAAVGAGVASRAVYVATLAALKAVAAADRFDGLNATLSSDGSKWRFASASAVTGDDFLVVAPTVGSGRWIRTDKFVDITAAIGFGTADAAVLYTVPTGFRLILGVPFHNVTTSWTGGSSSAIGLSSSNGGLSTAGDLLGGATGDVAAGLLSTGAYAKGTVGAKIGKPGAVLIAAETVIFNRITSVFTAGASTVHIPVFVDLAP